MRPNALILSIVFGLAALTSAAGTVQVVDLSKSKTPPKLPVLTDGCEGECCGILKSKKAFVEIRLLESPDLSAKQVGKIMPGESFKEAEFFTKILSFGEIVINGKKLAVIIYGAEGQVLAWDGKKMQSVDVLEGTGYKDPKTESWVRFKTSAAATGWARIPAKLGKELDFGWCG